MTDNTHCTCMQRSRQKNKEFYQHTLANTGTLRASDMDNF